MLTKTIPAIVLGGSGYVASEITGLLLNHPVFRVEAVVSHSNEGRRLDDVFPHLTGPAGDMTFTTLEAVRPRLRENRQFAVFSALPHGETAPMLKDLLEGCTASVRVVDVSADFRHADPATYAAVYGKEHAAPEMLDSFYCGLPDLPCKTPETYVSHPGCFTTVVVLALAPLFAEGLVEPSVSVSAVTGSTGAGRQPRAGTHHPERQSALWAYDPLKHRHLPEMEMLVGRFGDGPRIAFVPHSGPFSRGIHATGIARLTRPITDDKLVERIAAFYHDTPFVRVSKRMPSVKEVVGSNRCHIGVAAQGDTVAVTSVIDNLVKGGAGGAVQWMNRLFALDQATGLMIAVPGWI